VLDEPVVEDLVRYTTPATVPYQEDKAQPTFSGAQGSVFKASRTFATSRFRRESKTFAIKEISVKDKRARNRLRKEIDHLRRCKHQNVLELVEVYIIDQQEWWDRTFLVTQPWAQASLERLLVNIANSENGASSLCPWYNPQETQPWPSIVRQCFLGLEHLHNNRIRHKDLKPDNILLVDESDATSLEPKIRAIIADLGISKDYVEVGDTTFTETYQYLAPEQQAKESSTYHSDIFSLGCCISFIHAILSSKPLELCQGLEFGLFQLEELTAVGFSNVSEHILPLLVSLREDHCSRPQDVIDFLQTLEDIIKSALSKEPHQRGNLVDFLEKLDAYDETWVRSETIKFLDLFITSGVRTKVVPINVSHVKSDQDTLDLIKHHYSKNRSWLSSDWLLSPAEVRTFDFFVPKPGEARSFRYLMGESPVSNRSHRLLLEMLFKSSHLDTLFSTRLLEQLPIRRQTVHHHRNGSQTITGQSPHLGLEIVNRIDHMIAMRLFIIVFLATTSITIYQVIREPQDLQNAFALSSYVLTVCGLILGAIAATKS
jgi:serine/threonine protein kinase